MPKYTEANKDAAKIVTMNFIREMDRLIGVTPGLNRSSFARVIGTYSTLFKPMERGERYVTLDMVYKMIQHYPVSLNAIFGLEDESEVMKKIKQLEKRIEQLEKKSKK